MESTLDIAREDWTTFLDAFSRIHRGWRSRIEVLDAEIGAQEEGEDLPLMGISADFKDAGRESVQIALGRSPDDHVSHAVLHPTAIRVLRREDGADEALEISSEGAVTLLRFLSPAVPEAADGFERAIEPARGR